MQFSRNTRLSSTRDYRIIYSEFTRIREREEAMGIPSSAVDRTDYLAGKIPCARLAVPVRRSVRLKHESPSPLHNLAFFRGLGGAA